MVKMLSERCVRSNFIRSEHLSRIAAAAIIRSEHIRSHRFSETAWTAYADESLFRVYNLICIRYEFSLINVYLRIQDNLKIGIIRIKVNALGTPPTQDSAYSIAYL